MQKEVCKLLRLKIFQKTYINNFDILNEIFNLLEHCNLRVNMTSKLRLPFNRAEVWLNSNNSTE